MLSSISFLARSHRTTADESEARAAYRGKITAILCGPMGNKFMSRWASFQGYAVSSGEQKGNAWAGVSAEGC